MSRERKLYDELIEGVDSMRRQREGKITLPNAQAAALILMVQKYPDTFGRLQALDDRAA